MNSASVMPVLFVPHGGGPLPLMNDPEHRQLTSFMRQAAANISAPRAILIVTAHWEETQVTLSGAAAPGMIYDYHGFPPHTYNYRYPAPGDPALAVEIAHRLALFSAKVDPQRGFDHGAFVPLMLMYPAATVPVIQLSLVKGLEPSVHLAIGRALAPLREQGVLIVGSGMSFHNLPAFFSQAPDTRERSERFDQWLNHTVCAEDLASDDREARLLNWTAAPDARFCHPREEHLLPLHVCYGAGAVASPRAENIFSDYLFDTRISAFLWR